MRRFVVVLVLLLGATAWPAASGLASVPAITPAAAVEGLLADFNNDGFADLAIGVVGENLGAISNGGAVNVLYGTAGGLTGAGSQLFTQNSSGVPGVAEPGDGFGDALAVGDFDGDGFADLAVGVSLEDVGAVVDAGAVNVLYGAAGGLTGAGSQLFTQDSPGVGSSAETEDGFGEVLAAGDLDGDRFADLTVGIWRENVGATANGGAAQVLFGTASGLTGIGSQFLTQDSPGVPGVVERDDELGFAVGTGNFDLDGFADLAVGAPGEDYGAVDRGGAVNVLRGSAGGLTGSGSQLLTQNSPGVPGVAELGDNFGLAVAVADFGGDGFVDLAVGGAEDVGAAEDAGAINVLRGSSGGLTGTGGQLFTRESPGVPGTAQQGDAFGAGSLAAGDFDGDGAADLAAGVSEPSAIPGAGALVALPGSAGGLTGTGSQLFTQDSPGVPDTAELRDGFGGELAAGNFDADSFVDLAVGVVGETVGSFEFAGAVNVLPGSAGGLTGTGSQLFTQDSPGVPDSVEFDDFLGEALAASGP
jgi:FG-GAP-like repeat/FG-GAP repeat